VQPRATFYIFIFLSLTLAQHLHAEELQENFLPTRAMGMGNAFTAVANDENAAWSNPAGVARARKHRTRNFFLGRFPNVGLGVNNKTKSFYQAHSGNESTSLADTVAETEGLDNDTPYYANLQAFPVVLFDYARQSAGAFGLYINSNTSSVIETATPDQARVRTVSDAGALTTVSWTNRTNRLNLGLQFRYIKRYAFEDNIPTEELKDKAAIQSRISDSSNQTQGLGVDFGMMFTFADFWFPTLGVSVLNLPTGCKEDYLNPHTQKRETVCGTTYQGQINDSEALSVIDPMDIRVGISIMPRVGRKLALRFALDAHHIYVPVGETTYGLSGIEPQKMLHAGVELVTGNPLKQSPFTARVGMNQGLLTAGASIQIPYFAIDFATYGVDISSTSSQVEDRRYVTTITGLF